MTPPQGARPPEGKPFDVHEYGVREGLFHCTRWPHEVLGHSHDYRCDELRKAWAARDALHAETLASAKNDAEAWYHLLTVEREQHGEALDALRAALQHGEERERVMREALERIAEYEIDWREGPSYNVGVLQQRAEDALAAAQAMKEGT